MGLSVSHGAFEGGYSAFNRFRAIIAMAMGGSWPPHKDKTLNEDEWYYDETRFSKKTHPGLFELMCHSDCDGYITYGKCKKVADDLEALLPVIEQIQKHIELDNKHIENQGGYIAVTKRFIEGCRLAYTNKDKLIFM